MFKKNLLKINTIVTSAFLFAFTCGCANNITYSWVGSSGQSYVAIYDDYKGFTVKTESALNMYAGNKNSKEMLSQDLLQNSTKTYGMNPSITYEFRVSKAKFFKSNISFDLTILNKELNIYVLEILVDNLPYKSIKHPPTESILVDSVYFIPNNFNVSFGEGGKEEINILSTFWDIVGWKIEINIFDESGNISDWYIFSYKTSLPDERNVLLNYANFLYFNPFFFHSTQAI